MIRSILFAAGILLVVAACNNSPKEATSPSGFKYITHIKNNGEKPQVGQYAYFQLVVTNGDTMVFFDSHSDPEMQSVKLPSEEELNGQPLHPVLEALMLMSLGDSLTLYYPVDSLGPQRPPGLENSDFVLYNITLKKIQSDEEYQKEFQEKQNAIQAQLEGVKTQTQTVLDAYKAGTLGDKLQKTESGLQYYIIEEGTGPVPNAGQSISAHYFGVLMDGTEFDNSFSRGKEFSFPVGMGRVIPGWDEAFTTLKVGTKAVLFVPSAIAYGEQGNSVIPANSDLVFYVELNNAK